MKTGKAGTDRRPDSIQTLLALISQSYNTKAWHGTNLRGSIRGLTARQAAWRPAPNRHNVWEIVVHCAYWKYIVRRRIMGGKKGSFYIKGSNWFSVGKSEREWHRDVAMLQTCHQRLMEAVRSMMPDDLYRT